MQPHLLLIDALNLIRRVHAAVKAPDENSKVDGALSSTISSFNRAIRDCQPSHVLAVFDGDPPTWRHTLYPDYKSQRKPMPEALRNRLVDFNRSIRELGIMTFRRNGFEADDVIGAIASKAVQSSVTTTILSTDRIYQQLLSSSFVIQRDHFQKMDHRADFVKEHYSLPPSQLVDFWAIAGIGDIPGVSGVGDKGALKLMQKYESLDQLLTQDENPGGPAGKVIKQAEHAKVSRTLATLKFDIEVGLTMKELRYKSSD